MAVLEDTLRGLYREAGVPVSDTFDRQTQIKLATRLLKRRGLDDYLAGRMSTDKFAVSLSKEWASLPVPYDMETPRGSITKGQSYYAGDGLNAAHAPLDGFLRAIESVRAKPEPQPRESITQSNTVRGGSAVGVGLTLQQCGNQLADAAIGMPDDVARWLTIGGTLIAAAGAAYVIWERVRKWRAGDR